MGINIKQFIFIFLSMGIFSAFVLGVTYAQEATPTLTPTPTSAAASQKTSDLQDQIKELEGKVKELQNQKNTLSSQIAVMDNQVKLTQLRIDDTQREIEELNQDIETTEKRITKLESSLEDLSKVLMNRIVATYQVGTLPPFTVLISSNDVSSFFTRLNYLKIVQAHDKKLVYDTEQAKVDYANQKEIFEEKKQKVESLKKQLEGYTAQLENDKKAKQAFLAVTQNDERKYQELLIRARAEYLAIQGIVAGYGAETEAGQVGEGDRIASIIPYASCNSSGAHLHFIVSRSGGTENPFNYLKGVDNENCSGSSCNSGDGDPFNPSGSWNWPINPTIRLLQGYGSTWAVKYTWVRNIYNFHNGIDISGSSYDVKAVKAGTLYRGSYAGSGCRLPYVRVRHKDDGLDTFYLHVSY